MADLCPLCGWNTKVLETISISHAIRRRRQCLDCGHRYTTYESEFPRLSFGAIASQLEDLHLETQRLEATLGALIKDLIPPTSPDHFIENNSGIEL